MNLGRLVYRWRIWVLLLWALGAVALWLAVKPVDPLASEATTYLPPDMPSQRAMAVLQQHFPNAGGLSEGVVVFERPSGPLTPQDFEAIEAVKRGILRDSRGKGGAFDLNGVTVRSPADIPLATNPLVSPVGPSGQAALVLVNIPANFVTLRSSRVVDHIQDAIDHTSLPAGLDVAITGSSGYGHDYALAAERSNRRSFYVTIIAVIAILLLVFRAPLAALVPLGAVSLAAMMVLKLLDASASLGLHAGTAERMFVLVLLYGAGTDYSLLLISRYREMLGLYPSDRAAANALNATLPAILASGLTNTLGLAMLSFARFRIFQTTGPSVALALAVALLAAITLVPALLALIGPRLFWPRRQPLLLAAQARDESATRRVWPRLAELVIRRPGAVLAVSLVLLAAPAAAALRTPWVYDALALLGPNYDAIRGTNVAKRHWPMGQIAPVTVAVESDKPLTDDQWTQLSADLTGTLAAEAGIEDVRSLTSPLGKAGPRPATQPQRLLGIIPLNPRDEIILSKALQEYVSPDDRCMRLTVVLDHAPLSLAAMETVNRLGEAARRRLARDGIAGQVLLTGATSQMMDTRDVTTKDFHRIAATTLSLILVVVLVLLRQLALCIFMVACTLLGYAATLGLTHWAFAAIGQDGLDWKVEVLLFVVMVAVGVDYSIFLTARIKEESRRLPIADAIRQAVIHTGPVISSAGLIMAATLGSLMAGHLALLTQLGFALALGMLIDTFIVRPLLLPAFAVLTGKNK